MEQKRNNIFENVVKSEDQTTELLANYLHFKQFRDYFLSLFIDDFRLISNIEIDNIETQVDLKEYGRPDLVIKNDEILILFEIKISNTPLTDNQPNSYLKYLNIQKDRNEKWLILLVPRDYSFRKILEQRIHQLSIQNIKTRIIFWEEVIERVQEKGLIELSPFVAELIDLLKSWFEVRTITFTKEEVMMLFSSEMPSKLTKLFQIIGEVKNRCSKNYHTSWSTRQEEYGIYIKSKRGRAFFFGVWYPFWLKHHKPLCYGIEINEYSDEEQRLFKRAVEDQCEDFEDWRIAWINEETLVKDNCTSIITEQMERIVNELFK